MKEKLYPYHWLASAQLSLSVQAEKKNHWAGGGGRRVGGTLRAVYNGRFEKTVTFFFLYGI